MKDIKDFQARYNRWKKGERYWDIRGIDLPRYDGADKNTITTGDGSVFNIDNSAIGARNLEVTTPEIEVIGKKQYPYQSAFNHNADGLFINNVVDAAQKDNYAINEFIFRNSNQAKLANPFVLNDNGDLISILKRDDFTNPDIRYNYGKIAYEK